MGMKSSSIQEENLTENLDFDSDINPKKETILFSSDKTKPSTKHSNKKNNNITSNSNHTTTEEQIKSTKSNSTINSSEEKVKFKFQWKEDPKYKNKKLEVLLVGSFLENWERYEVMEKNGENGIYEFEMYLPKKEHLFKFIINNNWQCSDLYPKKPDKDNNINNFIDLTDYKEPLTEKIYQEDSFNLSKELNSINQNTSKSFNNSKSIEKKYDKRYPEKFKKYLISINNSNHNLYGTVNNSYKKVITVHHEKLSHLISEITEIQKDYLKISTTERKKHKFLTIIYYKPK